MTFFPKTSNIGKKQFTNLDSRSTGPTSNYNNGVSVAAGGTRQLAAGHAEDKHKYGPSSCSANYVRIGGGGDDTFLSITHYGTNYKIHMEFKYKLQIFEEILAYSWPLWAPTSA